MEEDNLKRKGFTLIELVVAMAIFLVLILIAFDAFNYVVLSSRYNRQIADTEQNLSIVMDQMTKELRQTVTYNDGSGNFGVVFPAPPSGNDSIRDLKTISTPDSPLASNQYYSFGNYDTDPSDDPDHPILMFYMEDSNGVKHRISYTLGVPNDGNGYAPPHYKGIPKRYWPSKEYEPCEVLYSNETWDGSSWTGTQNQPVTEQVITNFTVIRPFWSDKVIQIVIEAMVKGPTGKGVHKIRYIAQVTLRQ